MLLKLIKYDFREQFREHIGLYALVFVSALTEIILDSFEFDLVSVFFWALHSLSVIAMFICSLVIIVIYFRRNLLKRRRLPHEYAACRAMEAVCVKISDSFCTFYTRSDSCYFIIFYNKPGLCMDWRYHKRHV